MKKMIFKATVALSFMSVMGVAGAKETTLNVSTWLPPSHVQNAVVWPTWAKWVEEATEGRVKVKIEYTSNNPTQLFQMVEDGVTDAAFSFHGFVPGRFDLQEVVELPGLGVNAEAASAAHWRTYQKYFTKSGEHEGLELLALFAHGQGVMHTKFEVNSLDDFKGKKVRIGGGVQSEIGKRMQVTPVPSPGNKVYELLQTGVVDAAFMPATEQKTQRLFEVAPYVTILPKGMYMGSFVMFINPEFMESISKEDAEAIRRVSGEKLSIMAGKAWDKEDTDALAFAKEKGVKVKELSENDPIAIAYSETVKGLDEQWLEKVKGKKVDAKAALEMLRKEAIEYAAQQK